MILAGRENHKDIAELLLKAGADPNIQNGYGNTTLILAGQRNHKDIVELLLKAGAEPNIPDNKGNTALILAVEEGNKDIVELLLKAEADPNIQNNQSYGALFAAVEEGNKDIVELLLQAGADPFIPYYIHDELVEEARWKRLYARDIDTARRYAQSTSLPKDVWKLILLNKRQQQLCQKLNSYKNKGVLKYFALELNIPVTEEMTKGQLCALIFRQLAYGTVYRGEAERDIQKVREQVKQTAFQFGLDPNLPTKTLLKQLSGLF